MDVARLKTQRMDEITAHAKMPNKGRVFSGEADSSGVEIDGEDVESEKMMGLLWTASSDTSGFRVALKFKEVKVEVVVSYTHFFIRKLVRGLGLNFHNFRHFGAKTFLMLSYHKFGQGARYGKSAFTYCFVDAAPPKSLKIGDFGAQNRVF